MIDENVILNFDQVKNSPTWSIPTLRDQLKKKLEQAKAEQDAKLQSKLENVVNKTIGQDVEDKNAWKRVTIQADKSLDFLTLKKIMYSIYEAGGGPINFAVAKDFKNENATPKDKNQ